MVDLSTCCTLGVGRENEEREIEERATAGGSVEERRRQKLDVQQQQEDQAQRLRQHVRKKSQESKEGSCRVPLVLIAAAARDLIPFARRRS